MLIPFLTVVCRASSSWEVATTADLLSTLSARALGEVLAVWYEQSQWINRLIEDMAVCKSAGMETYYLCVYIYISNNIGYSYCWWKKILHHLGCIKPYKSWDIYHINWLAGFLQSTVPLHTIYCYVRRRKYHRPFSNFNPLPCDHRGSYFVPSHHGICRHLGTRQDIMWISR